MGGTSETTIGKLRYHVNNGNVHVHDDSKSLKFECKSESFKSQVNDALKLLKEDGVVKINGLNNDIILIKDGTKFDICLSSATDIKSVKSELESFLKQI
jgi:hypothetical protein